MTPSETSDPVTFQSVYDQFAAIWSNSRPIADEGMLRAALAAHHLSPGEVSEAWLRALNPDWVYLESDHPFDDQALNQEYRRHVS